MSSTADQPWVIEQRWDLTYNHSADPVTAHFLRTLRDEGKVLGVRCEVCGHTWSWQPGTPWPPVRVMPP